METIPFNGRLTIESPRGGHKTFQIKTSKRGPLKDARILSLFRGRENTDDAAYQGFAFVNSNKISIWRRLQGGDFEMYATMITSIIQRGEESQFYQQGYRLLMEKKCRVCNRALTNPQSIKDGIGPECAGRITSDRNG